MAQCWGMLVRLTACQRLGDNPQKGATMSVRTTAATLSLGLLGLGLALTSLAPADAVMGGNRTPLDLSGVFVVNDLCPFPVTIDAHAVGAETNVAMADGAILRRTLNEADTFSPG